MNQTDRHNNTWIRQIGRIMYRSDRQTEGHTYRHVGRQTNIQIRQSNVMIRQTDRQINVLIRQIDVMTNLWIRQTNLCTDQTNKQED